MRVTLPLAAVASALAVALCPAPLRAQRLSPESAVARAAEGNPSLRAAMGDVRAARAQRRAVDDALAPVFFTGLTGSYVESLNATAAGTVSNASMRLGADLGFRFQTEIGTELAVTLGSDVSQRETNRDPSTRLSVFLGPTWASDLTVTVRQPLMRGAGDVREAQRGAALASERAAVHRSATEASALVQEVLAAYWELWYAERALEVQEQAHELVRQQHGEAELRASQLGTLSPSDVLRFESELASIEESLSEARAHRDVRAIELGRLLGMSRGETASLVADSPPPETARIPTVAQAVAGARAGAGELLAAEAELSASRQRLLLSEDATRPQLDVFGSATASALFSAQTPELFQLPGNRPGFGAMVGIEMSLPIGPSRADAEVAEAYARHDAALARYEARVDAVEAQAASMVRRLEAAEQRVALARQSVHIAERLAEAERGRLGLGTSTPLEVLEAQQSHRQSQLRLLRALVEQATHRLAIDHLTGELVARFAGVIPNA